MPDKLSVAIEAVYQAFAGVRRPAVIEGCPCCIERKGVDVLLSKPLREISAEELSPYAASVFLTVGGLDDFRYLVPRILQISATNNSWWPDPEVVGRSLANGDWQAWARPERDAVVRLLETRFDALLSGDEWTEIDSWLCAVARAGLDLRRFLGELAANKTAMLAFYERNANAAWERRLANGFWDDAPDGAKQVVDWFHSAAVSGAIFESYGLDLNRPRNGGLG
ncbi:MAG: hypothetical protein RLZZ15_4226 [Verrucomicrobiota bacterium]|jgi:hypothetical protein